MQQSTCLTAAPRRRCSKTFVKSTPRGRDEDSMDDLVTYLTQHESQFEDSLCELLRIPSVSADPAFHPHCVKASEWVARQFREMGLATEVIPTCGQPLVFAQ